MSDKTEARDFALKRRRRRQWITFLRMIRYGINNFSRNTWLTIAATAVMTVTLLVVFVTLSSRNILVDTISAFQQRVDMSIYVKNDIKGDAVDELKSGLGELSNVKNVTYVSPEEARSEFAEQNKTDPGVLSAINEATNRNPGIFRVSLSDINDTSELDEFVKSNKTYLENRDESRDPSFAGPRRAAIQNIAKALDFGEKIGILASIVFVVISSLIVFNTIRMAIFTRKEEIQMMKLIGADGSFIRGPFVVEAVVYGFIAAVIATGLGTVILVFAGGPLSEYGAVVQPTLNIVTMYGGAVILGMIALGAVIGIISSLLATRKYLKI